MKHPDLTDAIVRGIELGLIPAIRPTPSPEEIDEKIDEFFLTADVVSDEVLQEQEKVSQTLSFMEDKGVMDAFYPSGFTVRRRRVFKPGKKPKKG